MITALAFLTAVTVPPPPPRIPGLVAGEDYPPGAMARGEQGAVYVQMLVSPGGRVDNCTVLLSSGSNDLDDATCRIVTARARFAPAQGEDGNPIYGTFREVINWRIAGATARPAPDIPPDLELTINQAPEGVKLPLGFTVRYFVKADGAVSRCNLSTDPIPPKVMPPQVLVDLVCDAVTKSPIQIVRNHSGQPVDANDQATVRFSVKR